MKQAQYGPHDNPRNTNKNDKKQVDIKRNGEAIVLPDHLSLEQAIRVLNRKLEEEEMDRCIQETIYVSPVEGAVALSKALKEVFGLTLENSQGSDISIEIGVNKTMIVRWGQYDLPMGGFVEPKTTKEDGRFYFQLHAHVRGKHEHAIRNLITRVRKFAAEDSPYRGKAFSISLTDERNESLPMPRIKFLDLPAEPIEVIVRPEIERDFKTCIWGPIRHTDMVRKMGTPLGRKILLAGLYGTGKTLTATRTAQISTENSWTFIYLPKASELPTALDMARQYEPCIVFVEDIDRVTGTSRTDSVNDIINALDGIGNKKSEVMVVFTTNNPESINPAMRRPGRIDTAINLLPPDGPTVARLLKHYAGPYLAPNQDLSKVGQLLNGTIPAQLREVVERAKLAVGSEGKTEIVITAEDLDYAAGFVARERELFSGKEKEPQPKLEEFTNRLGQALLEVSVNGGK